MDFTINLNTLVGGAIMLGLGLIGYFLRRFVTEYDKLKVLTQLEAVSTQKEMAEIKYNYLDRFDTIRREIIESERRTVDKIISVIRDGK